MICPSCAHENRAGAKFCEECAAALPRGCASCGSDLRPSAKFCDECGTPVAASGAGSSPPAAGGQRAPVPAPSVPSSGTRKIVTIVFADLAGSTAMQERLDPESVRRFMESYYDAMRDAVESHGGTLTQFLGDGVKAVFGIPRVAEDDAIRAVRAGVAMQKSFQALAERQRGAVGAVGLRVAVNTGEVVANADDEIIGDPVNVAARLQEQGRDGDVVVGDSTARLVGALVTLAPLGSLALKGRAEVVAAFLLESLDPPASAATAAFVGRDEEIVRLTLVYESAIEKPATSLAILLGSPGLGKSRLIEEFACRLGDKTKLVEAHCDQANSATFSPLAIALRELLAIEAGASGEALKEAILAAIPGDDRDRARIASGIAALLAGSPGSIEETFFVVRRLFASLASVRPVVLVIDDLQWAEPLFLDLVEHLVQWGSGVPMLVLVGARPELRDKRVSLTIPGGLVSDVVTLAGLDAGAAMRLAANVIGAESLPAAVAAKVLATSEGNPLFVGELVRMLVHEGALKREGDRWTTGTALAALEMPPTIHALLAARIERLQPQERLVLERASVVGRHFSRSAVLELLPRGISDLDARLETLRRAELIERDAGWFFAEPVLRFHHVLIRDAAYRQLLKGTRAELHTRFADWAFARAEGSAEHDETIGWHLEQAHQFLRELGPIDAQGRVIGERASTHLAAAGRRALAGDDVSLAASLLGRAIEQLDPADDARAELALDWCESLLAAGDVGTAVDAINELDRFVGGSDRLRAWHTCFAGQHTVLTAPEGLQSTADNVAAAAEALASQGDAAGEAKAHFVYALALSSLGKIGACEAALDRALAAARRVAGDRRRANTVLAIAPRAALWGPSPVTRASGRCLDVVRVLRITQGAPAVEAVALSCQGVLEALRGRTDAARRMIASARRMVEELGITQRLLEVDVFSGQLDLLEGDGIAAEISLRAAYDGLRELGLGIDAAQAAALLARALLAQDRVAEAETLSHESEALAGDDLKAAIAWRGVRAEALARRGKHAAAVDLASKAVEIAAATDALLDHADARLALAAALRAAGRGREADAEERRAHELWEAKGATLLAERARSDEAQIQAAIAAPESPISNAPTIRRHVRPNAATAMQTRVDAAVAARDSDALRAQMSDSHREIDHPTGSTYGPDECVASMQRLLRSRDPQYEVVPLATLGESLMLGRRRSAASGAVSRNYDVGPYENTAMQVFEVDERGLMSHSQVFAVDRLDDAIICLYERYAESLPESAPRTRAAAIARSVSAWTGPIDLDRLAAATAPSARLVDHRVLSTWTSRDATDLLQHFRLQLQLASDFTPRVEDVLAIESDAMLLRHTYHGSGNASGGTFENRVCVMFFYGADGLVSHIEAFEGEAEAEALARFEELTSTTQSTTQSTAHFANAASATSDPVIASLVANDWDRFKQLFAEEFRMFDRRRVVQLDFDRDRYVEFTRSVADGRTAHGESELLATRGERVALVRSTFEFSDEDVDPSEIAFLLVNEVDDRGRIVLYVRFDVDDEDAAYAELDERFEADEADAHRQSWQSNQRFVHSVAARDWDEVAALCADELVEYDHRSLAVLGTTYGGAAWARNFSTLVTLASDTIYRVHHFLPAARGYYVHGGWYGTRDGGDYEMPLNAVVELDERGLIARADIYDDGVDTALARLAELAGPAASSSVFANAATRQTNRFIAAWHAHDWTRIEALFAPEMLQIDRRDLMHLELDRSQHLESLRFSFDMASSRFTSEVLATRGDRLQLSRMRLELSGGEVGPSEIEYLALIETDDHGDMLLLIRSNSDDLDAAYAELDARFAAIGSDDTRDRRADIAKPTQASAAMDRWLAAYQTGFETDDWDPMRHLCSLECVFEDRRRMALLEGNRELMIASARERAAIGARIQTHPIGTAGDRIVTLRVLWSGGPADGRFEIEYFGVFEVDEAGLLSAFVLMDLDDPRAVQRQAWARWAAIDPCVTAVVAPIDVLLDAFNEQDAVKWHAAFSDDVIVDDHRLAGIGRIEGADAYTASIVALWGIAPVTRAELGWHWPAFAHYGGLTVLRRTGTVPDGGEFESEHLYFYVVAQGRITHVEMFELHALDAALARFEELSTDLSDAKERS